MPSSTSSSELAADVAMAMAGDGGMATADRFERPGFVRLTASDRPGVAQPVPERDIPPQPWGRILLGALVLFLLLMAAWEWHWRAFGATPAYRNSDGAWTLQRRRIDHGEGDATVLLGSSRMLSDVQLPVWERLSGRRPIQLALEGTTPTVPLEQLADDPDFTGRLLVDITANLFRAGGAGGARVSAFKRYREEGPSQRIGQWLSMRLLEPYLAFYDPDFALARVVRRQAWPQRPGLAPRPAVRKLFVGTADRNNRLWDKLEHDPRYLAEVRDGWAKLNWQAPPPTPAEQAKLPRQREETLQRVVAAVAKLRARGVQVIFIRHPTVGPYAAFDNKTVPRADSWDLLLARTGAPGIHFEDYPELQGYWLPEWSHMAAADADRYTVALYRILEREHGWAPPSPAPR
ncbi:hypothetical protein ACFQZQ_10750 [Lysobacter koreensis]|uniref:SGNH/GDSL hydrolase family protein n=1 Tax=Lysobacter koreensis TaxID=266122 RepID=A0ABW2YQF9_9GAMM